MTDGAFLQVRVTPQARRDEVIGWRDGVLSVRLRAPPVEGQANEALCRFVADRLNVPRRDIEIVSGATSRTKRLRISNVPEDELKTRLS